MCLNWQARIAHIQVSSARGWHQITVNGSHTSGSLITADGVLRCGKEMRSRHIRPTIITLGCIVGAVVSYGDTGGVYVLIHQMHDGQCRDALNSVIYCSVFKGFNCENKLDFQKDG